MNRDGPPPRSAAPRELSAAELATCLRDGATVVDTRPHADFVVTHARGTINVPDDKSFLTWSGALLPYDRPVYFIAEREKTSSESIADDLSLIGLDNIGGICTVESIDEIERQHVAVTATPTVDVASLAEHTNNSVLLVDVRAPDEWDEGHIPGSINVPLVSLQHRLSELPANREIAVHCQGGGRARIAASILQKEGFAVSTIEGGFPAWEQAGNPVERRGVPS